MKKILLLLISLILLSCSDSDATDEFTGLNFDQNTFVKNRQLWEANKILNYTFSQVYSSISIGSQPKLRSIVINNELDSIFIESKYVNNTSLEELTYYSTVDDVYLFIAYFANYYEEEIISSQSTMKGIEMDITYDDTFHYPTEIKFIGYYSKVLEGGLSLRIVLSDFEVKQ